MQTGTGRHLVHQPSALSCVRQYASRKASMSDSDSSSETRSEEGDQKLVGSYHDSDSSDEEEPVDSGCKDSKRTKDEEEQEEKEDKDESDESDESDEHSAVESSIYEDDPDVAPMETLEPENPLALGNEDVDAGAKELKKKVWLDNGWDESLPIPKMKDVEKFLKTWKRNDKNRLPTYKKFCEGIHLCADGPEEKQIEIFEIILGKLNTEKTKLDQQRQKKSLRFLWKQQFPKSKREKDGISFSEIENEEMLKVEQDYVPALDTAVKNMLERAKKCDKGHLPKAKIAAWEARLNKAKAVFTVRQKKQVEFQQQRARRAAKVGKARSKKVDKGVDYFAEDAEKQIQKQRNEIKKTFDRLIAEGVPSADAIDQALGIMDA